jgi:hypothetical protein
MIDTTRLVLLFVALALCVVLNFLFMIISTFDDLSTWLPKSFRCLNQIFSNTNSGCPLLSAAELTNES